MAKCNIVLRKNGESGGCPNEAVKNGQCSVHERKSSPAKSKALEKKKRAKSFTDALGREQEWPMGKPYLVERGHK